MSSLLTASPSRPSSRQVDPRGLRFAAALTSVVLAAVLLTQSGWLLAVQAVVFAVGGFAGVRRSPYAIVFAGWVRPNIGPPTETEDARPPQFAQLVGLAFATVGLLGLWSGAQTLGLVATGGALAAAYLNAAFGLCLGCELYLALTRVTHRFTRSSELPYSPDRARGRATTNPSTTTGSTPTTEVSA